MSITLIIQRNNSEVIKLDKDLVTLKSMLGVLKEDTSIIDPSFLIECSITDLVGANYLTVDAFSRSYFIEDISSYSNNLVMVTCHVDVLSSFKTAIRANKGIVFRQENDWNLYLNDGVLEVYQNPIVTTHEFPNGFNSESYVLALAGRPAEGLDYSNGIVMGSGGSGEDVKTLAGLANYAYLQLGNPYWFGTFGQTANSALLENRHDAYPSYYTKSSSEYVADYGKRVHDCVGIIKGYRWSETPSSAPVYNAAEDVDAKNLFSQCTLYAGTIGDSNWTNTYSTIPGVCVFMEDLFHVGVSMGNGSVVEARGSAWGVVETNLAERGFYWWGIPDWLTPDPQTTA